MAPDAACPVITLASRELGNRVIETDYNRRRLRRHPEWGYLTPHETRQRHHETKPDHALATWQSLSCPEFRRVR
ncbi:hypothetical protein GCM10010254_72720 [Streptomyces chromofuscus]|nr:hypothetical protein GCM10010254_72720 [Streptomyces chromofuscus]